MSRIYSPVWALPAFALFTVLVWGGCATQEDVPFPHTLDAGGAGVAGALGSVAGGPAGGAGAGGAAVASGGGGSPALPDGGAPSAGAGGAPCSGGAASCADACPNDPAKTAPGVCGCGKADTDGDGDGTPDCTDECPTNKAKIKAGCGCATSAADEASCQALIGGLAHRYAFTGSGTTLKDSKGTADAAAVNMSLSNTGNLEFSTGDQYADLPNALISKLTNVSLEAWVTWQGGDAWQRIFDFGEDSTGAENNRSTGRSYVFLSPHGDGNFVRAVFRKPAATEVIIDSMPSLTIGDPAQLVLVLDDDKDLMSLYVNGAAAGSAAFVDHLSAVNDVNNWLGRSQFATDPAFVGNMQDFRMYSVALSAAQVAYSFSKGADATYLTP